MNPLEESNFDDLYTVGLANYDERLRTGTAPEEVTDSAGATDPALEASLKEAAACLRLLEQVWPRSRSGHSRVDTEAGPTAAHDGDAPKTTSESDPHLPVVPGYEILGVLGRGGMAVVYKARQLQLKRLTALKMILSADCAGPQELARFRAEAEAEARLQHSNIVQIYEVGEHEGRPYLALEYVDGGSLATKLDGTPWAPRQAAGLLETLARAIDHAHQHGIIHRDLKPANILLQIADRRLPIADSPPTGLALTKSAIGNLHSAIPKVADFGLAKQVESKPGQTYSGAILGSVDYMAPEQAAGKASQVGPAADVYALGAILYELLTGRAPFRGESPIVTLQQTQFQEPVPPRRLQASVPRDLETICLKCLEKEPLRRYRSAWAMAEDLRRFLAGEPIRARPVSLGQHAVKWARRHPAIAALGLALLIVAIIGLTSVTSQWQRAEVEKDRAEAQQQRAQAQWQRAEDHLKEATREGYYHLIALADQEWWANRASRAEELLDACPVDLRGWEWHYLKRRCHTELRVIPWVDCDISSVAYSPDGRRMAATAQHRGFKVWDAGTGSELLTISTHRSPGRLTFSPCGRFLAVTGHDRFAKPQVVLEVRDSTSGQLVQFLEGHSSDLEALAYSPDGRLLATASRDRTVRVWSMETGKEVLPPLVHYRAVEAVAFSPDGRWIASGGDDRILHLWDASTGQELCPLCPHRGPITCLAFSPNGRWIAVGNSRVDERMNQRVEIKVWDVRAYQMVQVLRGHEENILSLTFTEDGSQIVSADDKTVRVWDATSGEETLVVCSGTRLKHAVPSRDGTRIAAACGDNNVRIWDATASQEARTYRNDDAAVVWMAISPDGTRFATAGGNHRVKIWETSTGQVLHDIAAHTDFIHGLAFSPDGSELASCSSMNRPILGPITGKETRSRLLHPEMADTRNGPEPNHVTALAYCPDGHSLVTATREGVLRVWDRATGKESLTWAGHRGSIACVAVSPDGRHIASGGTHGMVRVWDSRTGHEVYHTQGDVSGITSIAFSRDGRHMAFGTQLHQPGFSIWAYGTNGKIVMCRGHAKKITGLAFSPDDSRIASSSDDRSVRLWEVSTGREILTLAGHTAGVTGVVFSPDGHSLYSSSWDFTVRRWDGTP